MSSIPVKRSNIGTWLALLGIGAASAGGIGYQEYNSRTSRREMTAAVATLRDEVATVNSQNNELRNENASLLGAVSTSNAAIARLNSEIERLNNENGRQDESISNLDGRTSDSESTIAGLQVGASRIDEVVSILEIQNRDQTQAISGLESIQKQFGGRLTLDQITKIYKEAAKSAVNLNMTITHAQDIKAPDGQIIGKSFSVQNPKGSGIIVTHNGEENGKKGGFIVTNFHVINHFKADPNSKDKDKDLKSYLESLVVEVSLEDGTKVKAKPYFYLDDNCDLKPAICRECDIALLETTDDISSTKPVKLSAQKPDIGTFVLAVGNQFGFEHTATSGMVSGVRRGNFSSDGSVNFGESRDPAIKTLDLVQTDTVINPGNSGGMLLNAMTGEVEAIPTFIFPGEIFHGVGFAVSAKDVRSLLTEWIPDHFPKK